MNHSIGLSYAQEQLLVQLAVLGNEKKRFLDAYFVMQGKERMEMDEFLSIYTDAVQELLSEPDMLKEEKLHSLVLIGSQITIEYPDYDTKDSFTIVLPEQANPDHNLISFLSPLGRQLLLARLGELIAVATPSGPMRVILASITFAEITFPREGGAVSGS
ncbi:transcription elongation factor GreA [Paenibacillus algorifonticola]|uniref:Transcription elongation factor GreA n=1 Tax=Paenibacillus algorifonticola TaxID=684063 RepID=A0A1I2HGZ9_9BACL|nr:GreA/GreB family elongation factor [Paenibacillus algorifonticola]SFF28972.1 transcription elongation factor GreA [Paenibacillus algorifonticola]